MSEAMRDELIGEVIDQLCEDIRSGNTDGVFALLMSSKTQDLLAFLPKERIDFLFA